MKKLLLLGLAVLGLSACTPSANPINNDPNQDPTQNPAGKDENLSLNISASFTAPRNGGLIEIPVEYEGEYVVMSLSVGVHVVRSKAMQKGVIVVSVQPNLSEEERKMRLTVRYVSTIKPGGSLDHAEKNVEITQKPVAKEVLFADIAGANALYIAAEQGGVSKATSSAQRLYKIAATGAVDSVVFTDEYSDTATVKVNFIRNLSDKYVYMNLTTEPRNQDKYYVVRKTDGAVFAAKPPYIDKDTKIQTDHRQNIYYVSSSGLYKMYDYNNGVDILKTTKDYMTVGPNDFLVDQRGNISFRYTSTVVDGSFQLCYTASGEFANTVWNHIGFPFILKKEPEGFYFIRYINEGYNHEGYYRDCEDYFSFGKINCTLPATTTEVLADVIKLNGAPVKLRRVCFTSMSVVPTILLDNMSLVSFDIVGPDKRAALLCVEGSQSYKLVLLNRTQWPKMMINKNLQLSGDYLYGYNLDEIYRVNIKSGQFETLYSDAGFTVYDFSLSADGVITFSALELLKAQDVLCELRNGQIKVLKTDDSQKIIQLERIN